MSLDDVLAGMSAFEGKLLSQPSLYFEYDQHREVPDAPPEQRSLIVHFVNAKKGSMYFTSWVDPPPVSSRTWLSWKDPIGTYRLDSAVHITPEPDPNLWDQSHYTHALFLDCFKGLKPSNSAFMALIRAASYSEATPLALPKSIEKKKSEWRVRPELETVDNAKCLVLERPGRDILWVDADHGFVLRKRIYFEESGNRILEVSNQNLLERTAGVWLPDVQVITRFNPDSDPAALRGKLRKKETNRLVKVSFDRLPDSFFDIPLPRQNAFVLDHVRGMHYPVHAAGTTAEAVIAKALRISQASLSESRLRARWFRWALLLGAVLIGFLLLAFQWARIQAHRAVRS